LDICFARTNTRISAPVAPRRDAPRDDLPPLSPVSTAAKPHLTLTATERDANFENFLHSVPGKTEDDMSSV